MHAFLSEAIFQEYTMLTCVGGNTVLEIHRMNEQDFFVLRNKDGSDLSERPFGF